MYARVAVDVETNRTDELFTYLVPEAFISCVHIGSRVYVEFGFRKILGYIVELVDELDFQGNIKEIIDVVDFEQGLTAEQIMLGKEIAASTKSYLTSSLALMYPSFMKSKIRKYINVLNYENLDAELALELGMKKKVLITKELLSKYPKIKREEDKGNLEIITDIYTYGNRKLTRYYRLSKYEFEALTPIRKEILEYLKRVGEATAEEIRNYTGCSDFLIDRLVAEKYIYYEERVKLSEPEGPRSEELSSFNFDQKILRDKFLKLEGKPFLLHTNDKNFELALLLDLAVTTVKNNQQVLIITPTLLQNKVVLDYFNKQLSGYRLYQFNSKLSNHEYYFNYKNVQAGNVDIVIGMKNNVFLPFSNLGLIIMVDEDNSNYYLEQNPRYCVLEVLKLRSKFHNAKLLMTTATLSIESYYHYFRTKYYLLKYLLPISGEYQLVNMREEMEDLILSRALKADINKTINNGKTAMLILNNLGYNTTIICRECGSYLHCPKCRVSLGYLKEKNIYRCPSCNFQTENPVCECGSQKFNFLGFGLEKLRERLDLLFPKARVFQIDSESMQERDAYDDFFTALEEREIDIIIGTYQIVGFTHPNIDLVGIISIDSILNINDYRASEKAFRMIAAQRNQGQAKLIIQGYNLNHKAISTGVQNDFESFYDYEIQNRKNFSYPPFVEVNTLTIIGEFKDIYYYANYFKKIAFRVLKVETLGPVYIARLKGVRLTIRHQNFERLSELIDEVNKKFSDRKLFANFDRYPKKF